MGHSARFGLHGITRLVLSSLIFAARYMYKRSLCRRGVSVCLSVTFVYCVETAEHAIIIAAECE